MPIEWAIIFLSVIVACVYFSYNSGLREGVAEATILTLEHLKSEGLIQIDQDGNIKPGVKNERK